MTQPQMPPDLTSSEAYKRGESPDSGLPFAANECKLTECQGQPRCKRCLHWDAQAKPSAVDPVSFPIGTVPEHPYGIRFNWSISEKRAIMDYARAAVIAYAAALESHGAAQASTNAEKVGASQPLPDAAPPAALSHAKPEGGAEPQPASAELSQSPIVNQQPPQVNDEVLALISEATPFMERFAKTNPKWPFPSPGSAEHPAHDWLERAAALKGKP